MTYMIVHNPTRMAWSYNRLRLGCRTFHDLLIATSASGIRRYHLLTLFFFFKTISDPMEGTLVEPNLILSVSRCPGTGAWEPSEAEKGKSQISLWERINQ